LGRHQVHRRTLLNSQVDVVSDLLIARNPLCGRVLCTPLPPGASPPDASSDDCPQAERIDRAIEPVLVMYPSVIEDARYLRNDLRFGVAFVVDAAIFPTPPLPEHRGVAVLQDGWLRDRAVLGFSHAIRQMAKHLCTLEARLNFMMAQMDTAKRFLSMLLMTVIEQLRGSGRCCVPTAPGMILDLSVTPHLSPPVQPSHVAGSVHMIDAARQSLADLKSEAGAEKTPPPSVVLEPSASLMQILLPGDKSSGGTWIVHPAVLWPELRPAISVGSPLRDEEVEEVTVPVGTEGGHLTIPAPPLAHYHGPPPLSLTCRPESVPVRLRDLNAMVGREWDLALRRLLPFIDGVSHIRAIADAADVALPVALAAISQLVSHGLVTLIDIISPEAVYRLGTEAECASDGPRQSGRVAGVLHTSSEDSKTVHATRKSIIHGPRLAKLASDVRLQDALLRLIAPEVLVMCGPFQSESSEDSAAAAAAAAAARSAPIDAELGIVGAGPSLKELSTSQAPPEGRNRTRPMMIRSAIKWFSLFGRGVSVTDVTSNPVSATLLPRLGSSVRPLVQFALLHGILRRSHLYPVPAYEPSTRSRTGSNPSVNDFSSLISEEASATVESIESVPDSDTEPDNESSRGLFPAKMSSQRPKRVSQEEANTFLCRWRPMLDGTHSVEAICCAARVDPQTLLSILEVVPRPWPGFALVLA
jgi:hypothetical protein